MLGVINKILKFIESKRKESIKPLKKEEELLELDRIAKMLVRRDFELAEIREKREKELKELREKALELEKTRLALMNMLEDIEEERKKAEEEKNKTLTVITNFTDGLLVFDKDKKLSLINPQAENFFKIKKEEIIGRSILELFDSPISPLINLLGREIKGIFRKELPLREDLILEVSTIPMMSGEEMLGTLVILHDITREKMVEKIKTEFVSISAHQLRTPLSAIKWTLKMLLDGDLGELTKEQKEFLEKTYQSNERMINLINDLLNVTRIEEGKYLYKLTLNDLSLISQSLINSYKEEAKRKKIEINFHFPKELPKVIIDEEKIRLAIQNLIENAIRYTPEGGKIDVKIEKKGKEIEFSIKDTGIGIPKKEQERVFTKFFRGSNAIRMETEGSGLGLFITKNIVEAHGGRIWFKSKEGKGTTFYFTLPVKEKF